MTRGMAPTEVLPRLGCRQMTLLQKGFRDFNPAIARHSLAVVTTWCSEPLFLQAGCGRGAPADGWQPPAWDQQRGQAAGGCLRNMMTLHLIHPPYCILTTLVHTAQLAGLVTRQ